MFAIFVLIYLGWYSFCSKGLFYKQLMLLILYCKVVQVRLVEFIQEIIDTELWIIQ